MTPSRDISRLLEIMASLRTPHSGCPWDLEQNFASIAPYTIEEAYEVVDAIARSDLNDLCDELGDLLLQVVFHARMAEEQNAFSFGDVVEAITRKMIRRHPHVFADQDRTKDGFGSQGCLGAHQGGGESRTRRARRRCRARSKIPARQCQSRTARLSPGHGIAAPSLYGRIDWNDPRAVLKKIREEADEIEAALDNNSRDELTEETGDLMFALVNLARHAHVDPEIALRRTNAKFTRRFAFIERSLAAQGRSLQNASLVEMDALWNEAKANE